MEYTVGERKKILVTVPSLGKVLELRKPTLSEYGAYEDAIKGAKENSGSLTQAMLNFIMALGASEADAKLLDGDEYTEIVQFVTGSKKKN